MPVDPGGSADLIKVMCRSTGDRSTPLLGVVIGLPLTLIPCLRQDAAGRRCYRSYWVQDPDPGSALWCSRVHYAARQRSRLHRSNHRIGANQRVLGVAVHAAILADRAVAARILIADLPDPAVDPAHSRRPLTSHALYQPIAAYKPGDDR